MVTLSLRLSETVKYEQGAGDSGLCNLPTRTLGSGVLSALASLEEVRSSHGGCPYPGLLDPAPSLRSSVLRATTIFLPNFPAELTEACEGQGACPGSLSKTA